MTEYMKVIIYSIKEWVNDLLGSYVQKGDVDGKLVPSLSADGSDADKLVKSNSTGDGWSLVEDNYATEDELAAVSGSVADLTAASSELSSQLSSMTDRVDTLEDQFAGALHLPEGGSANQQLVKLSDADGDAGWADPTWEALVDKPFGYFPDRLLKEDLSLGAGDYFVLYEDAALGTRYDPCGTALRFTFDGGWTVEVNGEWEGYGYPSNYNDGDLSVTIDPNGQSTVNAAPDDSKIVKIEEVAKTVPLPEKYIPDTIARKTDIPEVPEQVQSDLAVNDESDPAYVKNRTHWVGEVVINNADFENSDKLNGQWVKVSADAIPKNVFPDVVVEAYGASMRIGDYPDQYEVKDDYALTEMILSVYSENADVNGDVFAETGVYVAHPYFAEFTCKWPTYHPLPPSLGGMPTLAEDGSDANKTVIVNDDGTGYEVATVQHVGKDVSGQTFTVDGSDVVACMDHPEVFNDYVGNVAIGRYAHAEGWMTKAIGHQTHTEGYNTDAIGNYSHAEGEYTVASGIASHAEGDSTEATGTCAHAEGAYSKAINNYAHAEGSYTEASGEYSHTEGSNTKATKSYAHAEGMGTKATGSGSHTEGKGTEASGEAAHAEGNYNVAEGSYSHAEGEYSTATGEASHAEGSHASASGSKSHAENYYTVASGENSHAENLGSIASGFSSHAEGCYTIAAGDYSHAQGKYNIADSGNVYAHIVGNGSTEDSRSNAHTVDWIGNAWFAGDVYVGSLSGTNKDDGSKRLATTEMIAQSDLSVNDTSSPAYVKNKTHWIEEAPTIVLENRSLSLNSSNDQGFACTAFVPTPFVIEIGKKYIVTWNGVAYTCVAGQYTGTDYGYIGVQHVAEQTGNAVSKDIPFAIANIFVDNKVIMTITSAVDKDVKVDVTLSVQEINNVYHTIDPAYLPASIARVSYVDTKVAGIVDSAPETLNTLNELSAALGNDENFATTVATQIGLKVDKVEGKGLSTNDYTTAEKTSLATIASQVLPTSLIIADAITGESYTLQIQNGQLVSFPTEG